MARTMSAIRRQSFAVVGAALIDGAGLAQTQLNASLAGIGRGDTHRGLLITLSAAMTIIGAAVPLLHENFISALLFLTGAAVASLALATLPPASETRKRANTASTSQGQVLIHELCATRAEKPPLDRAAWARLTAHMSHEFRTPLNAVLGFSELMSSEALGPIGTSCYSDYARNIHDSGRRLLKSAEDALAITALLTAPERKGAPAVVTLHRAFEEAAAFHAHDFSERRISIDSHQVSNDLDVLAEAQTVRQLLINVLADAALAARPGATIAVTTDKREGHAEISLALAYADTQSGAEADVFSLLLARTLCELSGAKLHVRPSQNGETVWTVAFTPAAQHDLFSERAA